MGIFLPVYDGVETATFQKNVQKLIINSGLG